MRTLDERLAPVIAHRGASAHAPENTLAALRLAAEAGATWVEFDVKLTRDGHCILMHDDFLNRTTSGRGEVARFDLDELRRLDAGGWFDRHFRGELIPTLTEALALCTELDLDINLEIKPCPGRQHETAIRVVDTLYREWPVDRPWPLISSFAIASLDEVRKRAPEFPRGLLVGRPTRRALGMLDHLACSTLHCDAKRASTALVRDLAARGRMLLCYTVNDAGCARRLLEMGVRAVFSDRPGAIAEAIARRDTPSDQ